MSCSLKPGLPLHAARFSLGAVVATPGAIQVLQRLGVQPLHFVLRHATGDFGELDAEDLRANEEAIACGFRVFSSYTVRSASGASERLWVITEADRSVTTLLLPAEY